MSFSISFLANQKMVNYVLGESNLALINMHAIDM